MNERIERLKPYLDKRFLTTLVEAAKIYGHSGDYVAVMDFVIELFYWTDFDLPDLEPYE